MNQARFFIAGAFKSGTTALASYLRTHPAVAISEPKEPYYFAADFPNLRRAETPRQYESLFAHKPRAAWRGEASAGYLYSQVALPNVRRASPDARIIVLLRRPDDLVRAFHGELLYARDEDQEFAAAWRLQSERRQGRQLPRGCRTPAFLDYREVGRLAPQLERLYDVFPRGQVRVFLFDELRDAAAEVYRQTLRFLDLDDDGRTSFPIVNPHRRHRIARIGDWTQRPPRGAVAAARWFKRAAGLRRLGLLDAVRSWNARPRPRAPLAPELARELHETFLPEVDRLEELIGRDLSPWRMPP